MSYLNGEAEKEMINNLNLKELPSENANRQNLRNRAEEETQSELKSALDAAFWARLKSIALTRAQIKTSRAS
ncbi:MAG: hypothetical protein K2Y39_21030 [Candidatus Obscuribacterales bacterium]|nr:hypothetical protein [Candidatus Obscuribacterales bacterium]